MKLSLQLQYAGNPRATADQVVGFEKGNPVTTDPKDRPAVDFREQLVADKDTVPKSSAPAKK